MAGWFSDDIRVANTATPSFQTKANVGNFGWTESDQGHYNQLIQYVDECRVIWKDIQSKTEIFDRVAEETDNIERAIEFVYDATKHVRDLASSVETNYQHNAEFVVEIQTMAANINAVYNDFLPKYQDFLVKYEEIINKYP